VLLGFYLSFSLDFDGKMLYTVSGQKKVLIFVGLFMLSWTGIV
jgi:hypothetical protein